MIWYKLIACSLPASLRTIALLTWEQIRVCTKNLSETRDKQRFGCGDQQCDNSGWTLSGNNVEGGKLNATDSLELRN